MCSSLAFLCALGKDAVSSSVEDAHMKPTSEVTHPSTPSEVGTFNPSHGTRES